MKKQIVFVEPRPTPPVFKIARTLKLTKKYENVLITFSKINQNFYKRAFDKIFVYELSDTHSLKDLFFIFKQVFSKKLRMFIKKIRKLNPYIVQITGLNIYTPLNFYLFKNKKTIYYAYDIWEPYKKKFSLKRGSGAMIYFNTLIEKICFKKADGILHKGPADELNLLSYNKEINVPDLAFLPGCLDKWNLPVKIKSKKNKEYHLISAGGGWVSWEGHVSFLDVIDILTSQKIHYHLFIPIKTENDELFRKIEKSNKYFHYYGQMSLDEFNKKISDFDYSILPDFIYDLNLVNPLFIKITMGNKIFSYIEAGLPIIVSDQLGFIRKIVEENGIGFSINYEDLKNLRKIIEKKDYKKLKMNVKKAQEKFSMSKNIAEIEKFYDKVHDSNRW